MVAVVALNQGFSIGNSIAMAIFLVVLLWMYYGFIIFIAWTLRKLLAFTKTKTVYIRVMIAMVLFPILFYLAICILKLKFINPVSLNGDQWINVFGGILGYYGACLLGMVAFWQNKKLSDTNNKLVNQGNRLNVLPIIAISRYNTKYTGNILTSMLSKNYETEEKSEYSDFVEIKDSMQYSESKTEGLYFKILPKQLSVAVELSDTEKYNVNHPLQTKKISSGTAVVDSGIIYIPCYFSNAGLAVAINLSLHLYKKEFENNSDWDIWTHSFNAKVGEEFNLGFYVGKNNSLYGTYILEMDYYNIHGEKYVQKHELLYNDSSISLNLEVKQELKQYE